MTKQGKDPILNDRAKTNGIQTLKRETSKKAIQNEEMSRVARMAGKGQASTMTLLEVAQHQAYHRKAKEVVDQHIPHSCLSKVMQMLCKSLNKK